MARSLLAQAKQLRQLALTAGSVGLILSFARADRGASLFIGLALASALELFAQRARWQAHVPDSPARRKATSLMVISGACLIAALAGAFVSLR